MKKLDRSKPFGEVFGNDPSIPYRYMQGGQFFDDAEKNIDPKATDEVIRATPETEDEMRARLTAEIMGKQPAKTLLEEVGDEPAKKRTVKQK